MADGRESEDRGPALDGAAGPSSFPPVASRLAALIDQLHRVEGGADVAAFVVQALAASGVAPAPVEKAAPKPRPDMQHRLELLRAAMAAKPHATWKELAKAAGFVSPASARVAFAKYLRRSNDSK